MIKLGNGDGTFTDGAANPNPSYWGVASDTNGDGKLDLSVFSGGRTRSGPVVYSSAGNGDGTFIPGGSSPIVGTNAINQFIAGDFNNDGHSDYVSSWGATNNYLATSSWGGPIDWGVRTDLGGTWFASGDFDGNGSLDLVMVNGSNVYIARNSMGTPPLLGLVILDSTFVVGGSANVTGTVKLGGPAPVGGSLITLSSSSIAAFFTGSNTVTVPAGATSATFSIGTGSVATATPA